MKRMFRIGRIITMFLPLCVNAQKEGPVQLTLIGNLRLIDKVHYEVGAQYNLSPKHAVALYFIPGFYKQHNMQGVYYNDLFRQNGILGYNVFNPVYSSKFITLRPSFLVKNEVGKRIVYNGIGINWTRSNNSFEINYLDPVLGNINETFRSTIETFSLEFSHTQLIRISSDLSIRGTFLVGTNLYERFVPTKEQTLFVHQEKYHPGEGFLYRDFLYVNLLIGIQWKLK